MDFTGITQLARSQGPVFWIATAAIALGATLLVVALVQQLRRVLAARRALMPATADPTPALAVAANDPAPDVYQPSQPPLSATSPASRPETLAADSSGDLSLALMLRRLQSAGDRLEEIVGDLQGEKPLADDSDLKEDLPEVEYVFRASGS